MIKIPKFFVTSDIHSFYTPLKKALDEAGFDPNNEEHWLIVCGDCFDRGDDSEKVLKFLMSLERKILVKGNHDILLEECCMREFPYSNDASNGTVKTIKDLGGAVYRRSFAECCCITWDRLARYRELLVNYFETQNYIFVHSWIPIISQNGGYYKYDENWRDASDSNWEETMWGNPFEIAAQGLNKTGITLAELKNRIEEEKQLAERHKDCGWLQSILNKYTLEDYCDKRKSTNLTQFNYCPMCGKKIDWKAIKGGANG